MSKPWFQINKPPHRTTQGPPRDSPRTTQGQNLGTAKGQTKDNPLYSPKDHIYQVHIKILIALESDQQRSHLPSAHQNTYCLGARSTKITIPSAPLRVGGIKKDTNINLSKESHKM